MDSTITSNNELSTYFGRCRCCLNYGYLKSMWTKYDWDGHYEIYGNMIIQCFGFTLEMPEVQSLGNQHICDTCIERIRDASLFKQQILATHRKFVKMTADETQIRADEIFKKLYEKKEHDFNKNVDGDSEFYDNNSQINYDSQIDHGNSIIDNEDTHVEGDTQDIKEADIIDLRNIESYKEIEFLEDDALSGCGHIDGTVVQDARSTPPRRRLKRRIQDPNHKWPPKLPKDCRNKTYKQYTQAELQKAIEAVVGNRMTVMKAANIYRIPYKTLKVKMQQYKVDPDSLNANKDKHAKFIEEIKALLTYTNATPFKTKAVRYYCTYCTTDGPHFDPEQLRIHNRTDHVEDKIKNIPDILKPAWLNEILKLDIDNLVCTVCSCGIDNWNQMFKHLKQAHKIVLDQAYTRIVPYVLKPDLKCALCSEKFTNYLILDGHMNAHYNNYVCDDCGDTFLSNTRLKQHRLIHIAGRFPCHICGKNFTLAKYRKKHIDTHNKELKFKCLYCSEKFETEYRKHVHVVEKHKEKISSSTCEYCGKTFDYRLYYLKHLRNVHTRKNVSCGFCNKRFVDKGDFKSHECQINEVSS